jgi:hypothetical protein
MDLMHNTGKKRSNTDGILSIFAEIMQQIGGAGDGKALIRVSQGTRIRKLCYENTLCGEAANRRRDC